MRPVRLLVPALAILALVFGAAALSAQEIETFPAYGEALISRLSADGRLLAAYYGAGWLYLWDMGTGALVRRLGRAWRELACDYADMGKEPLL